MTDAELLEEERKKKEAAAMGEVQPQAPVTFRDYSVPESPRASGLSVFTPSGEVKPGVDVSAITSAPETLPAPSEVNTALNQEVQVDSPSVEVQQPKPGFFKPGGFGYEYLGGRLGENLGEFAGRQLYGTGITAEGEATGFPVDRPSLAGDLLTLPGTALNVAGDLIVDPLVAGGEMVKDFAGYATGATGVEAQQEAAQAATGASASQATPSVTPTVETPSGGAQGQVGVAQSPFLQSPDTPSGLGGPLLRGFNMVNDASRPPNAPMGREATQAALGGRTLNEYLNAPAGTEGVSGLRTDPQGRMIPSGFETRADAFSDYEDQADERKARLEARPDFGDAVSDRDRRAARGEGISMADRTDMAKANARGASPSEIARGNKIADELGVDLGTGQPRETEAEDTRTSEQIESDRLAIEAQELQNERSRQIIAEANKPDATPFAKKRGEWEERAQALREDGMSEKEISARRRAFLAGDTFDPLLFDEGGDEDSTGQSASDAGATPAASSDIITIKSQEEYDKLPRGAKYKDSTGQTATKK